MIINGHKYLLICIRIYPMINSGKTVLMNLHYLNLSKEPVIVLYIGIHGDNEKTHNYSGV